MSKESSQITSGIFSSFTGSLAIVFVTLKLCEVIQWSWWLVLSPLWIPLVFSIIFFFGCLTIAKIIMWHIDKKKK